MGMRNKFYFPEQEYETQYVRGMIGKSDKDL